MNYRKNYIKIYFWQTISVLLGFAALFVVVPYISSNKAIYGIFSVCTSLTIFFSYADLGFFSSGVKYAAEYYIKGQHKDEMRIIGFTSFIMVCVFSLLAFGVIILGFFPKLLIPELIEGSEQMVIAKWLLFTLAISCPIIICQRLLGLVFTIRVEDYKYQRMNITGNVVRILSVLFFFGSGRYMIVEYFIFYQTIHLVVVVVALLYARNHYGYGLRDFVFAFKFDREIFDKVKKLTGTSIIMTASAIIYYELDQVVISNVLGIEAVATYAAALSILQLVRTYNSIVYSPYISRYNHFVGLNDYAGLTHFVKKMIVMMAPVIIIPILILSVNAKPFVISWVGNQYEGSAILVSFLVLSFVFNFFKMPIDQFFVAIERNKILIKYTIITPIIFWIGVVALISTMNTEAFAIMKFAAPIVSVIAYWALIKKDLFTRGYEFLSIIHLLKTVIPTTIIVLFMSWFFSHWMVEEHSKQALLVNILLMTASGVVSFFAAIPFNDELRSEVARYIIKK